MAYEHKKSGITIFLDIFRFLLIFTSTAYCVFLIWNWNWIVAIIASIPLYFIMLNLFGFLTLPLYLMTPENRLKSKAFRAFEDGEYEKGKTLTDNYSQNFNVNLPEKPETEKE